MELLDSYVPLCRDLDAQAFAMRVKCPFLVLRGALKPLRGHGPTIDRLVLGREDEEGTPPEERLSVFPLQKRDPRAEALTLGTSRTCDVQIDDQSVSRIHAHFFHGAPPSEFAIADNDSSAGTLVNGTALEPGERRFLAAGDVVSFGELDLLFFPAADLHAFVRKTFPR